MSELSHLHFIRPLFLLGIVILPLISILLLKMRGKQTAWRTLLPLHLQQHQIVEKSSAKPNLVYWLLAFTWVVACISLAGPTWKKLPQPVYQNQIGKVIILDMSMSMRSTDVSPDRLTRARFKSLDLLSSIQEGEIGLIAYAGDAFVISPLTDDIANLQNLIPSLSPEIMPVLGSNPLTAFDKANELLSNAGYKEGEIYWITDGIEYQDVNLLQEELTKSVHSVSVLLLGTSEGAPIKMLDGSLLKDNQGKIVIPRLNENYIKQALSNVSAKITTMTTNSSDIERMVLNTKPRDTAQNELEELTTGDVWEDYGVYLCLVLLPFVAYFFRKGVIVTLLLCVSVGQNTTFMNRAIAQDKAAPPPPSISTLDKLFLNSDQQAKRAFSSEDYAKAQSTFKDKKWKAASAYKAKDFASAYAIYEDIDLESLAAEQALATKYNKGNTLAQLNRLEEAIQMYDEVLAEQPDHNDAKKNRAIVESLLQQQNQENQNQDNDSSSDSEQNQQQQQNDAQNSEGSDGSESSEGQSENNPSTEQEQQNESGNQDQSQQNPSEQQNAPQDQNQSSEENTDNGQQQAEMNEDESTEEQNTEEALQNQQAKANQDQEGEQSDKQDTVIPGQIDPDDLSPEEREKLQQMQMLMSKVPDDPAFLLKRKMLLESQTRRQTRAPVLQQQTW
ncbi:VWA domain-containing protein [Agaribacter flavus]|uniref:VWA domain-containing protein n=1 Tax=Agaribacter flavus TaxID=1902781 RepID=A0ABV7FSQ7_9ALTE